MGQRFGDDPADRFPGEVMRGIVWLRVVCRARGVSSAPRRHRARAGRYGARSRFAAPSALRVLLSMRSSPKHRPPQPCAAGLRARLSLAYWRSERGSLGRAVAEFEQLIADQIRILGPVDPQTLCTRHHLARCRAMAGDLALAFSEFEQLLTDQVRILGPDNSQFLRIRIRIRTRTRTRTRMARRRREGGETGRAIIEYESLQIDQLAFSAPITPIPC
jgi:hypothetical protein